MAREYNHDRDDIAEACGIKEHEDRAYEIARQMFEAFKATNEISRLTEGIENAFKGEADTRVISLAIAQFSVAIAQFSVNMYKIGAQHSISRMLSAVVGDSAEEIDRAEEQAEEKVEEVDLMNIKVRGQA